MTAGSDDGYSPVVAQQPDTAPSTSPISPDPPYEQRLTPTSLAIACLLGGQRPPDLQGPLRFVHIGCGSGLTTVAIAAGYPHADVWAWDPLPENVEATIRRRDSAGLSNMIVDTCASLPGDLGGARVDILVVEDILVIAHDELRTRIMEAIDANLRPGGLACVTYKTQIGWIEIAPVVTLMRYIARQFPDERDVLVPRVLAVLHGLWSGDAKHLTARPAVRAWVENLFLADHDTILQQYLRDDFRPLSHAEVATAMASIDCNFVGSALVADQRIDDLPTALVGMIDGASTPVLRETYLDLATRRTERSDVFRRGHAPICGTDRAAALSVLQALSESNR